MHYRFIPLFHRTCSIYYRNTYTHVERKSIYSMEKRLLLKSINEAKERDLCKVEHNTKRYRLILLDNNNPGYGWTICSASSPKALHHLKEACEYYLPEERFIIV